MTQQMGGTFRSVWKEYEKALVYNTQIGLYDTVKTNEDFFIGKQWEGVEANGLPTPVFNFLKRVVLFTVAGITSSRLKIQASALAGPSETAADTAADIVNNEFETLFEVNKIGTLVHEYLRNTAVDGEKLIEKAGFRVNSFQEVKSFCGINAESITKRPKDYRYDDSIWERFDVSDFSERLILLCRMPILPFNELWNLYLNGDKEDRFGALTIMAKKHAGEMITELQSIISTQSGNKAFRKKLLELKTSPIIVNRLEGKQIISAINSALEDG